MSRRWILAVLVAAACESRPPARFDPDSWTTEDVELFEARDARFVVTASGVQHVVFRLAEPDDALFHTVRGSDGWSAPQPVGAMAAVNYTVAAIGEAIHVVWFDGGLWTSSFASPDDGWSAPVQVSTGDPSTLYAGAIAPGDDGSTLMAYGYDGLEESDVRIAAVEDGVLAGEPVLAYDDSIGTYFDGCHPDDLVRDGAGNLHVLVGCSVFRLGGVESSTARSLWLTDASGSWEATKRDGARWPADAVVTSDGTVFLLELLFSNEEDRDHAPFPFRYVLSRLVDGAWVECDLTGDLEPADGAGSAALAVTSEDEVVIAYRVPASDVFLTATDDGDVFDEPAEVPDAHSVGSLEVDPSSGELLLFHRRWVDDQWVYGLSRGR